MVGTRSIAIAVVAILRHQFFRRTGGCGKACYLPYRCHDPSVIIHSFEPRTGNIPDNSSGKYIGHHTLHAITGTYGSSTVIAGYHIQKSVVFILLSHTPVSKQPGSEVIDISVNTPDDNHDHFSRSLAPDIGKH